MPYLLCKSLFAFCEHLVTWSVSGVTMQVISFSFWGQPFLCFEGSLKESSVCIFSQSLESLAKKVIQEMLIGYWVPMEATTLTHRCHMARQYISGLGGILMVEVSLEYQQSFVMVSGMAPYTDCTVILALIQIFNLMTTSFGKSPLHAICWTQTHRDIQSHDWQPWRHP